MQNEEPQVGPSELKRKLLEQEIDNSITYLENGMKGQQHLITTLKILIAFFGAGLFIFLFRVVLIMDVDYLDEYESVGPMALILLLSIILFFGLFSLVLRYYQSVFKTRVLISDYRRLRMILLMDPKEEDAILYALTNDIFEIDVRGNKEMDINRNQSGYKMKFNGN